MSKNWKNLCLSIRGERIFVYQLSSLLYSIVVLLLGLDYLKCIVLKQFDNPTISFCFTGPPFFWRSLKVESGPAENFQRQTFGECDLLTAGSLSSH